jgi:hypothetical protein
VSCVYLYVCVDMYSDRRVSCVYLYACVDMYLVRCMSVMPEGVVCVGGLVLCCVRVWVGVAAPGVVDSCVA